MYVLTGWLCVCEVSETSCQPEYEILWEFPFDVVTAPFKVLREQWRQSLRQVLEGDDELASVCSYNVHVVLHHSPDGQINWIYNVFSVELQKLHPWACLKLMSPVLLATLWLRSHTNIIIIIIIINDITRTFHLSSQKPAILTVTWLHLIETLLSRQKDVTY